MLIFKRENILEEPILRLLTPLNLIP